MLINQQNLLVHAHGAGSTQAALRMGLLDDLLSSKADPVSAANADVLVSYETRIKNINALEDEIEDLTDDELR